MSDPKLFWKRFEERDDSTLPITPQKARIKDKTTHLVTKY